VRRIQGYILHPVFSHDGAHYDRGADFLLPSFQDDSFDVGWKKNEVFIGFFIDPSIARGSGSRLVRWQSLPQFFFGECFRRSVKADSFLS
jgi:hypothetical protein